MTAAILWYMLLILRMPLLFGDCRAIKTWLAMTATI